MLYKTAGRVLLLFAHGLNGFGVTVVSAPQPKFPTSFIVTTPESFQRQLVIARNHFWYQAQFSRVAQQMLENKPIGCKGRIILWAAKLYRRALGHPVVFMKLTGGKSFSFAKNKS